MAGYLAPIPGTHRSDPYWGGAHQIADQITELGTPGRYRVRLYLRLDGRLLRETWSDPVSGAYAFTRLKYLEAGYYVVGFDHGADPVNAAVADRLTPELPA